MITKKNLESILHDPFKYAHETNLDTLVKVLKDLSSAYYNQKPLVSDEVFDLMKDELAERDPNNPFLAEVGAPSEGAVDLPYWMGSQDKIKSDNPDDIKKLYRWKKKYHGPYEISDKMDGESGLLYKHHGKVKLYTRGDGKQGRDISKFISHIIPQEILDRLPNKIAIRGELIVTRKDFEKYGDGYKNPRNMVVGVIGAKVTDTKRMKILKVIRYVTYEIIDPEYKPSDQFKILEKLGFEIAPHKLMTEISEQFLEKYLKNRLKETLYDIDGVVVTDDQKRPRNTDGNPDYSFAFKIPKEILQVEVEDVLWDPSQYGAIKPRIKIAPTDIQGVTVIYATAIHGKYVMENKLGKGAIIKIIRSGDVIPKIVGIVKPAKETKMPDFAYKWDETGVNVYVDMENLSSKQKKKIERIIKVKKNTKFFKTLGVKYLSKGIITKLYNAGYTNPLKIIQANKSDLTKIEGIGEKLVDKIYQNIEDALNNLTMVKLMTASNVFGHGFAEKRLEMILNRYPNIIFEEHSIDGVTEMVRQIEGFNTLTAEKFAQKLEKFRQFIQKYSQVIDVNKLTKKSKHKTKSQKLKGEKIVFTGFRDKKLEEKIKENGGTVSGTVSSKTTLLLSSGDTSSSKYKKAKQLGIKIMSPREFTKKYQLN